MVSDEADEVIKNIFDSLKNRYKSNLKLMRGRGSLFLIMFSYCIRNILK